MIKASAVLSNFGFPSSDERCCLKLANQPVYGRKTFQASADFECRTHFFIALKITKAASLQQL